MKRILLALCLATTLASAGTLRRVPQQYPTIQDAINAADAGDTVLVSDGRYYENIRFNGKTIVVASTFLTTGDTSHISRTIIDGSFGISSDSGSVVYFVNEEDTSSVLCGFTITGGTGTVDTVTFPGTPFRYGAGILASAPARVCHNRIIGNHISTPFSAFGAGVCFWGDSLNRIPMIVESNSITNNSAYSSQKQAGGVGIEISLGNARIVGNTISENTGQTDASLWNVLSAGIEAEVATVFVANNIIRRNSAAAPNCTRYPSYGGGFHGYNLKLEFRGNTVLDNVVQARNTVPAYGGGIDLYASSAQFTTLITDNLIASNKAIGGNSGGGGGLWVFDGAARIENNIIVKNTAYAGGGFGCAKLSAAESGNPAEWESMLGFRMVAVQNNNAPFVASVAAVEPPILINNTIAYNKATANGGGIATQGNWTPRVINTIIWGDTASNEIYVPSGGIRILYSNVTNGWPSDSGNVAVYPQFTDSTYRLANTSGCLQSGIDSVQVDSVWYFAPTRSIYGVPRPSPAGTRPDIGASENSSLTAAHEFQAGAPTTLVLNQNFPNPFNPTTEIGFSVAENGRTTLEVFNVLGQKVTTLFDQVAEVGRYYKLHFNASHLASGMYLYRLQSAGQAQVRRLLLLR